MRPRLHSGRDRAAWRLRRRHRSANDGRQHGPWPHLVGGRLVAIGDKACTLGYLDGEQTWDVPAETVVFISYNEAQTELYRALGGGTRAPKPYELHLIGDANAPRDLLMAIREGHMAGRIQEEQHA